MRHLSSHVRIMAKTSSFKQMMHSIVNKILMKRRYSLRTENSLYTSIPIFRTFKGNENWFEKPSVREIGIPVYVYFRGVTKTQTPKTQTSDLRPRKLRPRKLRPRKLRPRKLRPRKLRPRKLRPRKLRPLEIYNTKGKNSIHDQLFTWRVLYRGHAINLRQNIRWLEQREIFRVYRRLSIKR